MVNSTLLLNYSNPLMLRVDHKHRHLESHSERIPRSLLSYYAINAFFMWSIFPL